MAVGVMAWESNLFESLRRDGRLVWSLHQWFTTFSSWLEAIKRPAFHVSCRRITSAKFNSLRHASDMTITCIVCGLWPCLDFYVATGLFRTSCCNNEASTVSVRMRLLWPMVEWNLPWRTPANHNHPPTRTIPKDRLRIVPILCTLPKRPPVITTTFDQTFEWSW